MQMLYLKTKPTPGGGGRWRPTQTLFLLAALLVLDARALPSPPVESNFKSQHQFNGGGRPLLPMRAMETSTATSAHLANIAVENDRIVVVVDWQSTCLHLCGSDLGGSGCGTHCTGSYAATERKWISDDFLARCPTLCSLRLGNTRCHCSSVQTYDLPYVRESDQEAVCRLGCQTNNPLNGCAECPNSVPDDGPEYDVRPINGISSEWIPTVNGTDSEADDGDDTETPATDDRDLSVEDTTTEIAATETATVSQTNSTNTDAAPSSTPAETTITESTTIKTTVRTTIKATTTTQKPPTTPDWTELCQNLCRIGEGGALCNCDLPPFF